MSRTARVLIATLVAIATSASTSAQSQSFGQIAKQEEARRAAAKKAARSFSNDDLPQPIVSPPAAGAPAPAEACYQSKSTGACVTAEEMIAASNAKVNAEVVQRKEGVWRSASSQIRSLLAKLQDEARVLATSVADEGRSPAERRVTASTLALKQRSIAEQERRWEKLAAEAAVQQIPREWYEPAPTLSTRTPQ